MKNKFIGALGIYLISIGICVTVNIYSPAEAQESTDIIIEDIQSKEQKPSQQPQQRPNKKSDQQPVQSRARFS